MIYLRYTTLHQHMALITLCCHHTFLESLESPYIEKISAYTMRSFSICVNMLMLTKSKTNVVSLFHIYLSVVHLSFSRYIQLFLLYIQHNNLSLMRNQRPISPEKHQEEEKCQFGKGSVMDQIFELCMNAIFISAEMGG